jgi:perosamine synthetase
MKLPRIPIFRPTFSSREEAEVLDVVRSGWIAMGQQVGLFENLLARRLKVAPERVVAVSSGTAALHLALILAGVQPGDEVLVPALGFIATANAVSYVGGLPVFVDVDPINHTAGPEHFAARLTSRTKALIAVHVCGRMAPMDQLRPWAEKRGLRLIEDAAPALGAVLSGRPAGTWGEFGCFSLHSSKPITAGEGGVLIAPDRESSNRARSLRFHGSSIYDFTQVDFSTFWEEEYPEMGFNYRMTDLQAAVARCQLEVLDEFLAERWRIVRTYNRLLAPLAKWLHLHPDDPDDPAVASAFQQYLVRLRQDDRKLRDGVIRHCREAGIFPMPGVHLLPSQPLWKDRGPAYDARQFPNATQAERTTISLPMYVYMPEEHLSDVAGVVNEALNSAQRL